MGEFDPARLTGEASLNRTVIAPHPDIRSEWHGQSAFALLSADPLQSVPAGEEGAEEIGERLAALLTTLRTAPPGDGRGLEATAWRSAYLAWWRSITNVYVGGGGAAVHGIALADACRRALRRRGDELELSVHRHAALMPLIGVARSAPVVGRVAAFDFGHTSVKRGYGTFDDEGGLAALELCPPVEVDKSLSTPEQIRRFALEIVESTLTSMGASAAAFSIAAYMGPDGAIADDRSFYNPLGHDDGESLRAIVRSTTGSGNDLVVLHDGTAAARAIPVQRGAAALTLGTALGVGFGVPGVELAPVSTAFHVIDG